MAKKSTTDDTATATDQADAEVTKGSPEPQPEPQMTNGDPLPIREPDPTLDEQEPTGAAPEGQDAPNPTPMSARGFHLGTPISQITSVEHAAATLKEKVSLLHTITHNMGHYATLAFSEVEQLMADIAWLVNFVRSKV